MRELQATRGGFVYPVAGILTLAAGYACWCGAPLIWDGAYQLNFSLIVQHPYVYRTRFHTFFLWQPVVLLSHYTSNRTALCMAFGLPFLLAPVVGLLVSWWLVRRQAPWLILWVIFGVAISPLPGQIFVINDSIFQQHLFWPLFMSLFVRVDWRKWVVLAVLAVFQFAHQIGFVLLLGAMVAALGLAAVDARRRRSLVVRAFLAGLLAVGAYWKLHHFVDPYAEDEMKSDAIWRCWGGTKGFPVYGLAFMWAAGALFWAGIQIRLGIGEGITGEDPNPLRGPPPEYRGRENVPTLTDIAGVQRSARDTAQAGSTGPGSPSVHSTLIPRSARTLFRLAFICVLIGATIWVYWAGDEHRWPWVAGYRRFVVPLTVPFYLLCWLDYAVRARRAHGCDPNGAGSWPAYPLFRIMGQLLAAVFAVVLGIQSTLFGSMVRRLIEDMRRYPGVVVPLSAVPWTVNTPMDHWTISDLAIAAQGKRPTQLLLSPEGIEQIRAIPPIVPNQLVYPRGDVHPPPPNSNGWYDLRPIVDRLASGRP